MADTNKTTVLPRTIALRARAQVAGGDVERGGTIPKRTSLIHGDVKQLRAIGRITEALRQLAHTDGTVSTALYSLVQVAQSGYTIKAYNSATHQFDAAGTDLARSVAASLDTLYDYSLGFSDKQTVESVIETGLREVALTGAIAGELVLNKSRLPERINPIAWETLTWKKNSRGTKFPVQAGANGDIELNIPNFWVATSHQEANVAYPVSMLEAALNTSFYYIEFIEDMRRAVRRSGHSRLIVTIDRERVAAAAPDDAQNDPKKMQAFLDRIQKEVESVVNSLEPEDALITYDSVSVDAIKADGDKTDYKELLTALSGLLATSLKSHPSILGLRLQGSQSLSNTESLVFLKTARSIQLPVEAFMSRAMTLAVRLYGVDSYVRFSFEPIDLRPKDELEAFKVMKQDRILELLSLGFVTDEEAGELLGTGPRPPGAPPLSGTMFHKSSNNASDASPNADPMGRALQPDTPQRGGGESQ